MRLPGAVLLASTLSLVLAAPSSARPEPSVTWERDYAVKQDARQGMESCSFRVEPYLGGSTMDPDYTGCITFPGKIIHAQDLKADGKAAVTKWKLFRLNSDWKASRPAFRQGLCVYRGGSTPGFRTGLCDKRMPAEGIIQMWAGKRLVSGSWNLKDMRFGDAGCIHYTDGGNSGFGNPYGCAGFF